MNAKPHSSGSKNQQPDNSAASAVDVGALEAELATQKDQYLRLAADFDNFRKRIARETERSAAAQKEDFIRELLPVIDNLERALASDSSTSPQQLREGVQMTLQQLMQLLRRHGIEPEESLGQPFDPRYHEAVSVRHDPSQPDHVVLESFQRCYRRGNEVFRPAKVVVNDLSHPRIQR
jgi:molecular chaperone GrpE